MPFNIGNYAAKTRRVVLKFNDEKMELWYNSGELYKDYEHKSENLQRELNDLQYRLANQEAARRSEDDGEPKADAYQALVARLMRTRRELADNICTVITSWDLVAPEEYDRTKIREKYLARMKKENRAVPKNELEELKSLDGPGEIPVSGLWLDALPVSTEFITGIIHGVEKNFSDKHNTAKNS